MTDKERLKEIKDRTHLDGYLVITGHVKRSGIERLSNDMGWLIEQAEQFEELKESIHIITTVRKSVYESHEQVWLIKKAVNDLK